jgi:hypothetical protein
MVASAGGFTSKREISLVPVASLTFTSKYTMITALTSIIGAAIFYTLRKHIIGTVDSIIKIL